LVVLLVVVEGVVQVLRVAVVVVVRRELRWMGVGLVLHYEEKRVAHDWGQREGVAREAAQSVRVRGAAAVVVRLRLEVVRRGLCVVVVEVGLK
jgi:hypothetical protein